MSTEAPMIKASTAKAYVNRIGLATPSHDIHAGFIGHASAMLGDDNKRRLFDRAARRSGIAHRYSFMPIGAPDSGAVDALGFYRWGSFPSTAQRMALYAPEGLKLALAAIEQLDIASELSAVTHLIVASCTGFSAPGLDLQLADTLKLAPHVERTMIGFMGCSAAIPALRAAHHIVRSEPTARVLVVNLELSSLHLQETTDLESVLSFLLFGDGCAATLIAADETGIALEDFRSVIIPDSADLITWKVGDQGFDMHLSGQVPGRITQALRQELGRSDTNGILRGEGAQAIDLWAVHAGGRTILDAVETGLALPADALAHSRAVLHDHGNMSSATVMFVLARMMRTGLQGARGMIMAFGPGMVAETARFSVAG